LRGPLGGLGSSSPFWVCVLGAWHAGKMRSGGWGLGGSGLVVGGVVGTGGRAPTPVGAHPWVEDSWLLVLMT
jgi:hypothetical protein